MWKEAFTSQKHCRRSQFSPLDTSTALNTNNYGDNNETAEVNEKTCNTTGFILRNWEKGAIDSITLPYNGPQYHRVVLNFILFHHSATYNSLHSTCFCCLEENASVPEIDGREGQWRGVKCKKKAICISFCPC
jgi:hypothetical protein